MAQKWRMLTHPQRAPPDRLCFGLIDGASPNEDAAMQRVLEREA